MGVEIVRSAEFLELVSIFPLRPIEDEDSYQAALEILDRLFGHDHGRTQGESDYFRALARIAFHYEIVTGMCAHC